MKLTDVHQPALQTTVRRQFSGRWALVPIGLGLLGVFLIDCVSGVVPFQHLYYLPIILAALQFGRRWCLVASLVAFALYHLADPVLLRFAHGERDVVQVALFVVVGVVTARLHEDARRLEALAGTDGWIGNGPGGADQDDNRAGEALCRAADAALCQAKRDGRGRVCVA